MYSLYDLYLIDTGDDTASPVVHKWMLLNKHSPCVVTTIEDMLGSHNIRVSYVAIGSCNSRIFIGSNRVNRVIGELRRRSFSNLGRLLRNKICDILYSLLYYINETNKWQ